MSPNKNQSWVWLMLAEHLAWAGPRVVLIAATSTLGVGTPALHSQPVTPARGYLDLKHADRALLGA